jgi:hypothetical protein
MATVAPAAAGRPGRRPGRVCRTHRVAAPVSVAIASIFCRPGTWSRVAGPGVTPAVTTSNIHGCRRYAATIPRATTRSARRGYARSGGGRRPGPGGLGHPPHRRRGNPASPANGAWPLEHPVTASLLWCAVLLAAFVPLTTVRYARIAR